MWRCDGVEGISLLLLAMPERAQFIPPYAPASLMNNTEQALDNGGLNRLIRASWIKSEFFFVTKRAEHEGSKNQKGVTVIS